MITLNNKLKNMLICSASLIIVMLTGCSGNRANNPQSVKDGLKGSISISGAFALYPLTVSWADEFKKLHPGVKIDISAGGAGKGMADVLSGMVDIGMISRSISPDEAAGGAWKIAVAKDAVVPVINSANPLFKELMARGLSRKQFIDIFIKSSLKDWGSCTGSKNATKIDVYTRSDACGAGEIWGKYLGASQEDIRGIGVYGDPGVADAVRNDVNGIGYNNVVFAYDMRTRKVFKGLTVVPIDLNADGKIEPEERFYDSLDSIMKAINENKYPSPPARELYFVTKGKPKNQIVIEFVKWILTDGQKYVKEDGYVNLASENVKTELSELEKN